MTDDARFLEAEMAFKQVLLWFLPMFHDAMGFLDRLPKHGVDPADPDAAAQFLVQVALAKWMNNHGCYEPRVTGMIFEGPGGTEFIPEDGEDRTVEAVEELLDHLKTVRSARVRAQAGASLLD